MLEQYFRLPVSPNKGKCSWLTDLDKLYNRPGARSLDYILRLGQQGPHGNDGVAAGEITSLLLLKR